MPALVHATPSDFPYSFVLEGDFAFKLDRGASLKAHRVTFASHAPLDSKGGVPDIVCFVDTTTDAVAAAVEGLPDYWRGFLAPAQEHPGRPARLTLESPPWMLARFNSALDHPWPGDAKDLLENQAWMGAALDISAYAPSALTIASEAEEVAFELPLDQKE